MKKIVWVFGESATGKETLIKKLCQHNEDALNTFGMNNKKLCYSKITIVDHDDEDYVVIIDNNTYDDSLLDEDSLYFNREKAKRRRSYILSDVEHFINDDYDVLLIKGQINDLRANRGNTLSYFLKKYGNNPDIQIEVIILEVEDIIELRRRLENKSWFKKITDASEKERLLETIPLKQQSHIDEVINAFSDYNALIMIYESLDNEYQLNSEKTKNL